MYGNFTQNLVKPQAKRTNAHQVQKALEGVKQSQNE